MKVGFYHDSPMQVYGGNFYSITLDRRIWERYLSVFDEMVVSTRIVPTHNEGPELSNHPKVSFQPIESYKNLASLVSHFPQIVKEVEASLRKVDCAIVRLPSVIGWITYAISRKLNKPILVEMVGCPWDSYRFHSKTGRILAPFAVFATKLATRNAPFVIYVTQNFLQGRYPTNGQGFGISDVNITTNRKRLDDRLKKISKFQKAQESSPLEAKFVIGSIGKIDVAYKGHRTAIEAVSKLVEQGYNIEYEIIGPGEQAPLRQFAIERGVGDRIRLLGSLPSSAVHEWLDTIDIYVQPSFQEGLPRSVVEALAHGLPVALSNVGGQPELVPSDYLFPPADSAELVDRIQMLVHGDLSMIAENNFQKSVEYDREYLQSNRKEVLEKFRGFVEEGIY